MSSKREYSANVTPAKGGTETVLVRAYDRVHAKSLLEKMGYKDVRNVEPV